MTKTHEEIIATTTEDLKIRLAEFTQNLTWLRELCELPPSAGEHALETNERIAQLRKAIADDRRQIQSFMLIIKIHKEALR